MLLLKAISTKLAVNAKCRERVAGPLASFFHPGQRLFVVGALGQLRLPKIIGLALCSRRCSGFGRLFLAFGALIFHLLREI